MIAGGHAARAAGAETPVAQRANARAGSDQVTNLTSGFASRRCCSLVFVKQDVAAHQSALAYFEPRPLQ